MPRPDPKAPRAGQESLFEATAEARIGQVLRGRHSDAMDRALSAAAARQITEDVDEGLATVLRSAAWALDSMEKSGHHYGPAKLIPGITEALREAHMTPESRQTDTDSAIAELLTDLAAVEAVLDAQGVPCCEVVDQWPHTEGVPERLAEEPADDDAAIHHAED